MLNVSELRRLDVIAIACNVSCMECLSANRRSTDETFRKQRTRYLTDFVNGTKQQPMNHLQLHPLMYRNRWKNSKAIQMKKCTRLKQSIGN